MSISFAVEEKINEWEKASNSNYSNCYHLLKIPAVIPAAICDFVVGLFLLIAAAGTLLGQFPKLNNHAFASLSAPFCLPSKIFRVIVCDFLGKSISPSNPGAPSSKIISCLSLYLQSIEFSEKLAKSENFWKRHLASRLFNLTVLPMSLLVNSVAWAICMPVATPIALLSLGRWPEINEIAADSLAGFTAPVHFVSCLFRVINPQAFIIPENAA